MFFGEGECVLWFGVVVVGVGGFVVVLFWVCGCFVGWCGWVFGWWCGWCG